MDLNGDGHLDLISGSWPGEIFFFRGGPGRTFEAPEMLKDKEGKFINIGGGIQKQPDGSILITGHGEFETTDEGTFVKYHGERMKSTPEQPISITGTASAVHAVDWDGDGDQDLLIGEIGGSVYLVTNEGGKKEWAFAKHRALETEGKKPVRVEGDAGPFVADWDGDGDQDLIVGSGDGSVSLFRNAGSAKEPKLAAAEQLVPPGEAKFGADVPKDVRRGIRAKVCAADWNGDGRLDLLVGDYGNQKPDLPEPTAEQRAEHEKLRAELQSLQKGYREAIDAVHGPKRVKDAKERELAQKRLKGIGNEMQEIRKKLPPEYESHGWVWLFLRKPAEERVTGKQPAKHY